MCIICYHETDHELPTLKHMQNCWSNNPDGAGMACYLPDENKWQVEKGFMNQQKFEDRYAELDFKKEDWFILHWRIATSGLVDAARTHPFPLTERCENMTSLKYKRKKIVFHNGVVGQGSKDFSDTMIAIRDWIIPLWKYMSDDKIYYLLEDLWSPSRLLICDGATVLEMGDWTHGADLLWSNDGFKMDKWEIWKAQAQDRREWATYTGGTIHEINKYTSVFNDIEWVSPYRKENDEFDWSKFEADEKKKDRDELWEIWKHDPADDIAPSDTEDCMGDDSTIGMVDPDGIVTMDATYHEDKVLKDFLMCPNCFEDKYLQDTPFNMGDTICLVCGCVYCDPSGEQVYFDPDINVGFMEHKKEVESGHA